MLQLVRLMVVLGSACIALAACQSGTTSGNQGSQPSTNQANDLFPQRHTLPEDEYVVTAASEIQVVYIHADNCPPCVSYAQNHYPQFTASEEFQHINFRKLTFPTFSATYSRIVWPDDLEWLMTETVTRSGAPRWLVLVDGQLISNERSWTSRALPLIQSLVAKKLAA